MPHIVPIRSTDVVSLRLLKLKTCQKLIVFVILVFVCIVVRTGKKKKPINLLACELLQTKKTEKNVVRSPRPFRAASLVECS